MTQRQELSIVAICGVLAILALIALAFLTGCTGTWGQRAGKAMAAAQEVAKAASARAEPAYRAKCGAIAKTCKGLPCADLEACQLERRRVNAAIKAVHAAVRAMADVVPLIEAADKGGGR